MEMKKPSGAIIADNVDRIKSSINKNNATRGLFFFVALPTILAIIYYYVFAADIYVSEAKFSVNVEGSGVSGGTGGLGTLMPILGSNSNLHEALTVKEYIESPTIVGKLEKAVNLREIFDNPKADFYARIPSSENQEDFFKSYERMVDIVFDDVSGITEVRVRAFSPEDSHKLATAILNLAEQFVNEMSNRMHEDAVKFAKIELDKSEKMIVDINNELAAFRNTNHNFDPAITATSILGITATLEGELAKTNSEIANLRNYMKSDSPKIASLEAKASALRQQINAQSGRLASDKGSALGDLTQEYEAVMVKKQFALKRYEVTVTSFEAAQAEARKKSKYLLRVVEPTKPEIATEPQRFKQILTIFFACLIGYTLGGLILAAIKDHIRP